VAQDRQRQRRRRDRQPGAGGPAAGSGRTDPRDGGLEPTDTDLSGATPAPEPTKHAFPDVEAARMAEAGPVGAGAEEDGVLDEESGYDPAPDAESAVAAPGSRRGQVEREPRAGGNKLFTFLGHVVDELRRVQWPDRRQVGQSTLVVLLFVILAGGYLGLLDALLKPVVDAIL
jgi:preprotein translocase SecE subunit